MFEGMGELDYLLGDCLSCASCSMVSISASTTHHLCASVDAIAD